MHKWQREHPTSLPPRTPYYLLLVFVPLIRRPLVAVTAAGILGLWLVWRWRHRRFALSPYCLRLERGRLWRRTVYIPLYRIATLSIRRPLWLRLLRAAQVTVDTDAGIPHTDARLTVTNAQAALFLPQADSARAHAVAAKRLWLLAVLSSDSPGGVILLAAAVRQSSLLLGEHVQQTLWNNFEAAADMLERLPRVTAMVILTLVCGWTVGAVRHLLRHLPFAVHRGDDTLTIYAGWLTRRIHCCTVDAIHYTDQRQTLIACLLRRHTVYIRCAGYGKDKATTAVVVPPCSLRQAQRELAAVLPSLTPVSLRYRPCRGAGIRYMRLPLAILTLLLLIALPSTHPFPLWQGWIRHMAIMGLFPCCWWMTVHCIAHRRAGIGYADGRYTLCYSRGLTLHCTTIPRHKIAAVKIRQTPRQQRRGACDLFLYTYHAWRRPHRVRHLAIQDVGTLFPIKEV